MYKINNLQHDICCEFPSLNKSLGLHPKTSTFLNTCTFYISENKTCFFILPLSDSVFTLLINTL